MKLKILDVPVHIGVDFILIMLVLGALWRTPAQLPAWIVVVTASVFLHEFGHAALFDSYGFKPAIRLYGGGGVTTAIGAPGQRISPRQDIVVAAAGPATGLILGGIVGLAALAAPRIATNDIVQDLLWVSLGWSLINLLPFPGTDGGSIVNDLTTLILGRRAEMIGRVAGLVVVGAVFVCLVLLGQYYWAFIIAFFAAINLVRIGLSSGRTSGGGSASSSARLLSQGRYQEAFDMARVAMADHPSNPGPILVASDALRLMSRYADAELGYGKVLEVRPWEPGALRGRACVRRRLGRTAEADADMQALLGLSGSAASVSQAAALYDADRHEEGYKLVIAALDSADNPVIARALTHLVAVFEYTLGREDEALRDIEAAIRELPDRADLHQQRALILIDQGRLDEAQFEMRRALADKPLHPEYQETIGIIARMAGHAPDALQPLVFSATARPADPRARAELALCHVQLGQLGEARAALETLPGYALRDPFAMYARAAVAAVGGAGDEAIRLLREARRLRPELAIRAGIDPLFRSLLADPARRVELADAQTSVRGGGVAP